MIKVKSHIKVFSHILVWCIILLVPIYIMSKEGTFDSKPYISYLVRTSILAILFYINYLFLIDIFLFKKQFLGYVVSNFVLVSALVIIQTMTLSVLMPPDSSSKRQFGFNPQKEQRREEQPPHGGTLPPPPIMQDERQLPHRPPFAMRIYSDYLMIVFVLGLSVAMKMTVRWYGDSIKFEQEKSGRLEADLRNLRSQLNPHFLFNTLNNIYSLIAIDQMKAQDSVHRLSNLLRYVLYDNDQKLVPIEKELEFTRNYIDLMRLRVSSNVRLDVLIENKGSSDMVASLMFMTLIENAFKHGLSSRGDCFIDIKILVEKQSGVLCTVENSLPDTSTNIESANSGIGLANLTKRLELIYPGKHEFIAEKRDDRFFTLLRIDFT
ncbi:sensor histidine kinase [Dysgonomonas macrotermitis]|uniref:Histidine kinase n=1 Tax=Dysgonomonas macrotermitis TaxID=1346286 RepID=A0A1M5FJY2_9BACT|nr:histidine kinase [Dysgonomonas macrotermitis]SHF91830.1 Histidine kinase [Dysgonomonas macrotermitis]